MGQLAVIDNSKEIFAKLFYNMRYGLKFKKLNIDKSFSECLIIRRMDQTEKDIFL